ncbi:hypothetical protein DQQ10_06470 [Pseudochryseolinea flava]|uniref:Cytochrome c domain-containing protein n=2 Tax=Pseudochryseolinea flava TaxID=2059302 RepID=A0A364Y7E1_9BACT|nr:hypothetical protein DQQ10_06470 [Pseudochryseolinea flava]
MFCGIIIICIFFSFTANLFTIPKTWDVDALKAHSLPPPDTTAFVDYAPESYYDSIPTHVIYKTFPVYLREYERKGYLDSLRNLKPEIAFDETQFKTQADWIRAGEMVFNWPVAYTVVKDSISSLTAQDFKGQTRKITDDGRYPFNRYVILENGTLLKGSLSCASCHTRVMPDGKVIQGAQGNIFNNSRFAQAVRSGRVPFASIVDGTQKLYFTPWAPSTHQMTPATSDEFADALELASNGVAHRQGGSFERALKIPSLFGVKDLKYLDHTGQMINNGPADLMRYAALNQGADMLTSYNGFVPAGIDGHTKRPGSAEWKHPFGYAAKRYNDAQLFALTQYIYSLKAPRNPERSSKAVLKKGASIFKREGCVTCHTPPLYTNNKLTPANGFEPPVNHFKKYDIFNVSVGTDSTSTLYTRRGTGYYKIPSLRNIWMHDAFFHHGELSTLEDVFNPVRLNRQVRPVKGHPFGLSLSEEDKTALIAFLKSL